MSLEQLAGRLRTWRVEVYVVKQPSQDMGGLCDKLLEASLLQGGSEGVLGRFHVVQVAVHHDDCDLGLVQMREHFASELLDLGAACKTVDVNDFIVGVEGLQEGAVL